MICNYWWKNLKCTHKHLARTYNQFLNNSSNIPEWLVEAVTTLIYKKGDQKQASNYRPIACLNTCYKAFTKILKEKILMQIEPTWSNIYEQRGAKKDVSGYKENLNVDRCICEDARKYKRQLSMAWIDYRKAFDSTPHDLILFILDSLGVNKKLIDCIRKLMKLWKTKFKISQQNKIYFTKKISFKRGVFQGDSLSPLLFCLTLVPLTLILRKHKGYNCGRPNNRINNITHLLYMDDLKIYMTNREDLKRALDDVVTYSKDIAMDFGVEKCAVVHVRKGEVEGFAEDVELVDGTIIKHLQQDQSYTYLGMEESGMQNIKEIKIKVEKQYKETLRKIWKSRLSSKNKVVASNMLATSRISYTFGVIRWSPDDLKRLDRYTRKVLTKNRSHHPRASVPRMYMSRQDGGRGLLSLEMQNYKIVMKTYHEILNATDPILKIVKDHEKIGSMLTKSCQQAINNLQMDIPMNTERQKQIYRNTNIIDLEKKINKHIKNRLAGEHKEKTIHGLFYRIIEEQNLSEFQTFQWLRSGTLRSETEGFLISVQDGIFNTLLYKKNILKCNISDINCRKCKEKVETLNHLLASCSVYAKTAYIARHNNALKVLYFHLRHHFGIDDDPVVPYTVTDIESVCANSEVKIYWNFSFATTKKIAANKPDLVIEDIKTKDLCIVEFSCPLDANIQQKESEKKQKYTDLIYELKKRNPQSNIKLVVIIIGVLGGITKKLREKISSIPGCSGNETRLMNSMQQQVVLGSLHLLRQHEATYT